MVDDPRHSRLPQSPPNPLGFGLAPPFPFAVVELHGFEAGMNQRTISPQLIRPLGWVFGAHREHIDDPVGELSRRHEGDSGRSQLADPMALFCRRTSRSSSIVSAP